MSGRAAAWCLALLFACAPAAAAGDPVWDRGFLLLALERWSALVNGVLDGRRSAPGVAEELAELQATARRHADALGAVSRARIDEWGRALTACQAETDRLRGLRAQTLEWRNGAAGATRAGDAAAGSPATMVPTLRHDQALARLELERLQATSRHYERCNVDIPYAFEHLGDCLTKMRPGTNEFERQLRQQEDLQRQLIERTEQRIRELESAAAAQSDAFARAARAMQRLDRHELELDRALGMAAPYIVWAQDRVRSWSRLAELLAGPRAAPLASGTQAGERALVSASLRDLGRDLADLIAHLQRDSAFLTAVGDVQPAPSCLLPVHAPSAEVTGPMATVDAGWQRGPYRLGQNEERTTVKLTLDAPSRVVIALWLPAHDPSQRCGGTQPRQVVVWLQGPAGERWVAHTETSGPLIRLETFDLPVGESTIVLRAGESDGCGWPEGTLPALFIEAMTF